jgi:hypothetical protein
MQYFIQRVPKGLFLFALAITFLATNKVHSLDHRIHHRQQSAGPLPKDTAQIDPRTSKPVMVAA